LYFSLRTSRDASKYTFAIKNPLNPHALIIEGYPVSNCRPVLRSSFVPIRGERN